MGDGGGQRLGVLLDEGGQHVVGNLDIHAVHLSFLSSGEVRPKDDFFGGLEDLYLYHNENKQKLIIGRSPDYVVVSPHGMSTNKRKSQVLSILEIQNEICVS